MPDSYAHACVHLLIWALFLLGWQKEAILRTTYAKATQCFLLHVVFILLNTDFSFGWKYGLISGRWMQEWVADAMDVSWQRSWRYSWFLVTENPCKAETSAVSKAILTLWIMERKCRPARYSCSIGSPFSPAHLPYNHMTTLSKFSWGFWSCCRLGGGGVPLFLLAHGEEKQTGPCVLIQPIFQRATTVNSMYWYGRVRWSTDLEQHWKQKNGLSSAQRINHNSQKGENPNTEREREGKEGESASVKEVKEGRSQEVSCWVGKDSRTDGQMVRRGAERTLKQEQPIPRQREEY